MSRPKRKSSHRPYEPVEMHHYSDAAEAVELPGRVIVGPDMIERINDLERRVALMESKVV